MLDLVFLVVVAFLVLCIVGWAVGGTATVAGNVWRNHIDPHERRRQERIARYRAEHPNEPVYTPWKADD